MKDKRIIYAGTPEFAAAPLQALIEVGYNIIAVYTQPDRKSGRGQKLTPSAVKEVALAHDIPVFQPLSLKDESAQAELAALNPDLMIVTAYGLLLPKAILETPILGCVNIHASLLPRWRGAAPIQRALIAGDTQTGITLMQMDEGLDTGAMLAKKTTDIIPEDTSASLHNRLMEMGATLLIENIDALLSDTLTPQTQNDAEAIYAHKLSKAEAQIDWSKSASQLAREIAGFNPWPVAYTQYNDALLRIWQAQVLNATTDSAAGTVIVCNRHGVQVACGEGVLNITLLQLPGKKVMAVSDFSNAYDLTGAVLE